MAYHQVTYRELLTHADQLGVQVIAWDKCEPHMNKLGTGASMSVFSGTCEVNGKTHTVAFKTVHTRLTETTGEKKRDLALRDIKQEIRIMGCLKGHSRIVQLLGVSFNDHMPILILELAKSNLEDYLQENGRVEWKIKLGFVYDIALGLEAIHQIKVVHGDLKASNILIYDGGNGQIVAKISDFGFSSTDFSIQQGRTPGFSYHFRSPESFDANLKDWNGKAMMDIYSYGLVVYQIAHDGTIPLENYDFSEMDNMKIEGTELKVLLDLLPGDTPMEIRKIMTATVRNVPSERLDLNGIKNILKESTEWNQFYSDEEAKIALESLQTGQQDIIKISKMMKLPIPPSLKKSIFLECQRLADSGDILSQQKLGSCWYYGFGTEQNLFKAFEYFTKAVEGGNMSSLYSLGDCYENGYGVTKDITKALELYTKAAEFGNTNAQNSLGNCYINGRGVTQDLIKAVELYTKAANGGSTLALYNLGVCYANGQGVTQDFVKAVELFTKAAEDGNTYAQNNLAICYETGQGVTQDYSKAMELYQKAAEAGNALARRNIERLTTYKAS